MTTEDLSPIRPDVPDRPYNLFRNRRRPDLLYAVPEDYPVPNFAVEQEWVFDRALRTTDTPPPGFHTKAAAAGVRFNRFYLFQLLKSV